jgi:hypothetical protein
MRRSLASHYRIKTAHHLLNIVALKREMDTYSVDGLLKAASTGHSKEACLRYAGLQAAVLLEKRALDEYASVLIKQGGGSPPSKPTFTPAAYAPKPTATPRSPGQVPGLTTEVPGLSKGMQMDVSNGTSTGQRQRAITAAGGGGAPIAPYVPGTPQSPGMLRDIANGTDTNSRRGGIAMAGTNAGGGPAIGLRGPAAGTNPGGGMPVGVPAAKLSAGMIPKPSYTADPVEDAYSKQLNEGAAFSAASKQKSDEDAYMKSIEPNAPTYKTAPEPTPSAAPTQPQGNGREGRFFNGQGIGQGIQNRGRLFGRGR